MDLKNLDNYQFLTDLTDLEINHNLELKSMKNTNLKELTRLKYMNICYNLANVEFYCESSNPTNKNIRYHDNSFIMLTAQNYGNYDSDYDSDYEFNKAYGSDAE